MQWRPLRLVQKRWKALYIVGGGFVFLLFSLSLQELPESAWALVTLAPHVAWIYFGTRIFRGREELLQPPRPLWRMTARPRAGFILGGLFAVTALYCIPGVVGAPLSLFWWTTIAEYAAFAALYITSSVRLRRGGA